MDELIFLVEIDFGDKDTEILAFIIRRNDIECAQAIVDGIKATWWDNDDPNLTYEDAIEREFCNAHIWFKNVEYYVANVDYYS